MSTIAYYTKIYGNTTVRQPEVLREPEKEFPGRPILNDAKEITLAEYDVDTKDAITAHHLSDYRRRQFNLVLLPKLRIIYDNMLEGSDYWNALLHHESSYKK